jgi:hypothetical protein
MKVKHQPSTYLIDIDWLRLSLHWADGKFPLKISTISRCNFGKRITWIFHTKIVDAKAFITFITAYSLPKIESLHANQKTSIEQWLDCQWLMFASPENFQANTKHSKLQRGQNKVLLNTGKFPRCKPFCELNTASNHPHLCDCKTKLCRHQVEFIQNHETEHVPNTGQGEATHRKYKWFKVGGGQSYDR